jgi:hypothetical protein
VSDPRQGARVRLYLDVGIDWGNRFPGIIGAIEILAVRSCMIDGYVASR